VCNQPTPSQWSLGPDPRLWGADLSFDVAEDDDELHRPEKDLAVLDRGGGITSARGIGNLGCLLVLILGILGLLCVLGCALRVGRLTVGLAPQCWLPHCTHSRSKATI
jgi:hypothetical protein